MKITEKAILKIIREEYTNRLLQLEIAAKIAEAQLMDQRGNTLISKDLKVKHRESGYEYTVDRVEGEGDNAIIYLRKPDTARFKPPSATSVMNEIEEFTSTGMPANVESTEQHKLEDVFPVSVSEFEKEYIID